jgi:hypothetical protein
MAATTQRIPQRGIPEDVSVPGEITVLQLPKFKAEATELIGSQGIEAVAVYLLALPYVELSQSGTFEQIVRDSYKAVAD